MEISINIATTGDGDFILHLTGALYAQEENLGPTDSMALPGTDYVEVIEGVRLTNLKESLAINRYPEVNFVLSIPSWVDIRKVANWLTEKVEDRRVRELVIQGQPVKLDRREIEKKLTAVFKTDS